MPVYSFAHPKTLPKILISTHSLYFVLARPSTIRVNLKNAMETRSRVAASPLDQRLVRSLCRQRTSYECEIRAVTELAWSWDEQDEWKIGNVAVIRSEKREENL